jgi:hypothetical protein
MHHPYTTEPHPLVRKMESIVDLTPEEREALRALPMMVRELRADQDIVRDGDQPSQCCLVLDGFTIRYKLAGEDRRQILSIHIPGEIPDLQSLHLHTMDHSLATLTIQVVHGSPVSCFGREQPSHLTRCSVRPPGSTNCDPCRAVLVRSG